MRRFWRRLTWQGRLVFLLLFCTLGMTALANISLFQMVGQMGLGVWVFWEPGLQCMRVSPVVSPHWPPIAEGQLHPSDCLVTIDGKAFHHQPDMQAYLTQVVAGQRGETEVHVTGFGKDGTIDARLPLIPWTVYAILQAHLLNFIPGVALWIIGLLLFLAAPNEQLNQALAAFFFLGGMLLMGLNHWLENSEASVLFDIAINQMPRPLMAILLIRVAMLFPKPVEKRGWHVLFWALLLIMPLAMGAGVLLMYTRFMYDQASAQIIDAIVRPLGNFSVLLAGFILALRLLHWNRRHPSPKLRNQTFFLLLGIASSFPILLVDLLNLLSGMALPFIDFYNLSAMGWIIPGAAMVAYAMLRYQAFAYRGQFLSILLVFFISAVIVQAYTLLISLGRIDGVQWAMLWGAVLLTTTLFYADTPLRRFFIRYFARHYYDYEVVVHFVHHVGRQPSEKRSMQEAARELCRWLRVEWVVIWSALTPDQLWIASHEGETVEARAIENLPPKPPFEDVVHQEWMQEGEERLGVIWFGPRVTAEPFDEGDQRLARLLAAELARMMALQSYITQLEATPARILAAIDRERDRIGRDLHDGVLQFLGALPFSLERLRMLYQRDVARADALIEDVVRQVEVLSQETRGLAYDLSLPGVREGNLLEMAYHHAQFKCRLAGVELNWHVRASRAWGKVNQQAAVHVYRILQEALHNAIRHGHPSQVTVVWDASDDWLTLEIIDDGEGVPADGRSQQGLGMTSMRERARALGGRLEVTSRPGQGVRVRLVFK